MKSQYDDIINLPHHTSEIRPRMPLANRAAQFSSFAALTGYEEAIEETARLTDHRPELAENAVEILDRKLAILSENVSEHPEVKITHFRGDTKKSGGTFICTTCQIKRIDEFERIILLINGERINVEDIINIESELFQLS